MGNVILFLFAMGLVVLILSELYGKTVRHLAWVFCLLSIWPLYLYFPCSLQDDRTAGVAL